MNRQTIEVILMALFFFGFFFFTFSLRIISPQTTPQQPNQDVSGDVFNITYRDSVIGDDKGSSPWAIKIKTDSQEASSALFKATASYARAVLAYALHAYAYY